MLKVRLTRNRVIILTIVLLLSYFTLFPMVINYFGSEWPPGRFYDRHVGVLFSGVNKSGLVACPWVLNGTDQSVLGVNQEFREYFNDEFSAEIQNYSLLTGFEINYTFVYHLFKNGSQHNPTDPAFDPYYGFIYIQYDVTTRSNNDLWNDEIASALETSFRQKWYISKFRIDQTIVPTQIMSGFILSEYVLGFLVAIIFGLVVKKKNTK